MREECVGYWEARSFPLANSKSWKSKPGETVQPTNEKETPGAGLLANQQLAGTTNWKRSPFAISLPNKTMERLPN